MNMNGPQILIDAAVPTEVPADFKNYVNMAISATDPAWNQLAGINQLKQLLPLEDFDDSVLANWRSADVPIVCLAAFLGSLSSVLLRDYFADLHDAWGKTSILDGGHANDSIDWVPGNYQPGGFGHRWAYGHDICNPFEIDWKQYIEAAEKSGTCLPYWVKGLFYFLRHLCQDAFSKEGLPLPFHSYIRQWLFPAKNHTILQYLGTIKSRDIVGTALTNCIMGAYIWGTENDWKKCCISPNVRGSSLMMGANLLNVIFGLLAPPPTTSLNWNALGFVGYFALKLANTFSAVDASLARRTQTLLENRRRCSSNHQMILEIYKKQRHILSSC